MLLRALDDDDAEPPALTAASDMSQAEREAIKRALMAVRRGDFTVRVDAMRDGIDPGLADVVNDVVELNQRMTAELRRIRRVVGGEGRIRNRASTDGVRGGGGGGPSTFHNPHPGLGQTPQPGARPVRGGAPGRPPREG